jgi:hypothetical protein
MASTPTPAHVSVPNPLPANPIDKSPASTADIEAMKILNQHWMNDNNVINVKLTQYIGVQTLLILGLEKITRAPSWLWFVLGSITSIFWIFSMGRTYFLRKKWHDASQNIISKKTDLGAFDFLQTEGTIWYAMVSTALVQIGVPVIGLIIWVVVPFMS